MINRRNRLAMAAFVALLLPSAIAHAKEREEMVAQPIHAPLPLYTFDWEQLWPRSFSSGEDFGCSSRVAFGDWRFTPDPADQFSDAHWARFTNYGVFHCAAVMRTADEQAGLDDADPKYGFFVQLGTGRRNGATWELWALQKGTVPGSEYTLLARVPGETMIDRFTVLQQRCPSGALREAKGFDIWSTRYCAIESRAELLGLGRRMLTLPALGTITRIAEAG